MCNCGCNHGAGVIPGECVSRNCCKSNENLRIKTVVLPVSVGTDEKGQPYAPALGAYTNTLVQYSANDAIYLYDSKGIYTKLNVVTTGGETVKISPLTITNAGVTLGEFDGTAPVTIDLEIPTEGEISAGSTGYAGAGATYTAINAAQETINAQITELQEQLTTETNQRAINDTSLQDQITALSTEKQDTLVSGTNIKTIGGESILGSGNLDIATEQGLEAGLATKQDTLVSGTNIKTVNGQSLLGAGEVTITPQASTVLYTGTAAATSITLSEVANNFSRIDIVGYYANSSASFPTITNLSTTAVYYPSNDYSQFSLSVHRAVSSGDNVPLVIDTQDVWTVSEDGGTLTFTSGEETGFAKKSTDDSLVCTVTAATAPQIIITKVIGYQ